MFGGADRGGLDGLQRSQAGADQEGELLGVVAVGGDAAVGAEGDFDAALVCAPRHLQHLRPRLQRLGGLGGSEEIVWPGGDARDEIARQQGRHKPGAVLLEQADRLVVQIGAVFDGIAAGAQEGVDAVDAVSVSRDLAAHPVSAFNDGGQFGITELLVQTGGGVGQDPAGGRDLDDVGAGADLGADRAHTVFRSRTDAFGRQQVQDVGAEAVGVAVAAVNRHGRARCNDARPRHVARLHRLAQGEDRFVVGPEIGDGGEARHQGAARIAGADHGLGGL